MALLVPTMEPDERQDTLTQRARPVIGFLSTRSVDDVPELAAAFRKGLNEIGYMEGRNTAIEYRWTNNDPQRLPELGLTSCAR